METLTVDLDVDYNILIIDYFIIIIWLFWLLIIWLLLFRQKTLPEFWGH